MSEIEDKYGIVKMLSQVGTQEDLVAIIPAIADAFRRVGTEYWWMKDKIFAEMERNGFHITQNHFYSAQPEISTLAEKLWASPQYQIAPFNFKPEDHLNVFAKLAAWRAELLGLPAEDSPGFYWENPFFPPVDAIVYYGLIRMYAPETILEIGCGYSSYIAVKAAKKNDNTKVLCIEPYPSPQFKGVYPHLHTIVERKIQEVPLDIFGQLRAGDILFVDTSHVTKIGGDLNHIVFRILPSLAPGVMVHFHDVFLPWEYPRMWVKERNWFWNEQYLLLAFMMFNTAFDLLIANNHLVRSNHDEVRKLIEPLTVSRIEGASLWIHKKM